METILKVYNDTFEELVPEYVTTSLQFDFEYVPWVFSIFGSILIGLTGVLPLIIIKDFDTKSSSDESSTFKILLGFAVGGLLGDVFLHLLPEAFAIDSTHSSLRVGTWILVGILSFTIIEKFFSGFANYFFGEKVEEQKVAGYLNLMANSIDNFTHGLAVAGSFLVSFKHGVLATTTILLHEIPHEIGDFAILMKSGFSRYDAAKAQILTAGAGTIGALIAIGGTSATDEMEKQVSWVVPFTAGGFLNIALVTVLPELLQEKNPNESLKQFTAIIVGIVVMAFLTITAYH